MFSVKLISTVYVIIGAIEIKLNWIKPFLFSVLLVSCGGSAGHGQECEAGWGVHWGWSGTVRVSYVLHRGLPLYIYISYDRMTRHMKTLIQIMGIT